MTSLTPTQMVEEAKNIRSLDKWPRWPWLPVKRSDEIGVIFADDIDLPVPDANGPVRVYGVNVFQCSMKAAVALATGVPCPWPVLGEYTDVEALLDAGWMGD